MATVTVASIVVKVQTILQDVTGIRWPEAELLGWLNDGQREVVLYKPNAFVTNENLQLVQGTRQDLPASGVQLIDVVRNMGTSGSAPGRAIRITMREILDAQVPDWHNPAITTPSAVDGVVGRFVVEGPPPAFTLPASALDVIKRAFSVPATIEGVLNALSNEAGQEFANSLMMDILKASPTSLKVTLEQLRRGAKMTDIAQNYKMEYRLSQGFMDLTGDFTEGVRAVLIDKTNDAAWKPSTISQVEASTVAQFFNTVPSLGDLELQPVPPAAAAKL